MQCGDERADVGDAVLEQVADAALRAGEELGRVGLLDVLAEDDDRPARGCSGAERERGAQALVA